MSNLQTYNHFQLDFQKVDQHTGGKWLIHGTKTPQDQSVANPETWYIACFLSLATFFKDVSYIFFNKYLFGRFLKDWLSTCML